jgi:streptogramin lyase
VAADAAGNIYFVEPSMGVLMRIDAQTSTPSVFAGTGKIGFRGNGGPATKAELARPFGLAVDTDGNVFIADGANNRIQRVDSKTGIITTVAGNGWPRRY